MALADALEKVEHSEECEVSQEQVLIDPNEKNNQNPPTATELRVRTDVSSSSLRRVMLGENKIIEPEAPWVVNLRASSFVENAYMW